MLRAVLLPAAVLAAGPLPARGREALAPIQAAVMARGAATTSCREVAHVGDSTSLGLVSKTFLPNESEQIAARYRAVGVEHFFPEISGARSLVETLHDQPNATEIVRRRQESGYAGCYVLALGTNDPANTSGSVAILGARIDRMMARTGSVPVLWTTTKTLKTAGPYKNANMTAWNRALVQACARHPNMRVYDWAGEVQDAWFTPDGVHFNGTGYRERAARIAKALALAFPKDGVPPSACLVHTTR